MQEPASILSESRFGEVRRALSGARLDKFRLARTDQELDLIARYCWNMELASAIYPLLQLAEVALRNALHRAISTLVADDAWYDRPGHIVYDWQSKMLTEAKSELQRGRKAETPDGIVGELHFGFWTGLFEVPYDRTTPALWPTLVSAVFPYLNPPGTPQGRGRGRAFLQTHIEGVRRLRNRISHHEPIWRGRVSDVRSGRRVPLANDHKTIRLLIAWMNPTLDGLAASIDRFEDVYAHGYALSLGIIGPLFEPEPAPSAAQQTDT